jgi:cell division protein FtsN
MAARNSSQKSAQKPRPKGATTRRPARRKNGGGSSIPGWLWGIAGMIAGFALAQYFQQSAPPIATVVPKPASTQKAAPQGGSSTAEEPPMPTFEFYTLLPESEVIAPKGAEAPVAAVAKAPAAEKRKSAEDAAGNAAPQQSGRYMLQAASFKNVADARRLAGRLKDFGLVAKISEVEAQGNQIWHRVQVGPYQDSRELNRAQDLMVTQGIEPLMIRLQN